MSSNLKHSPEEMNLILSWCASVKELRLLSCWVKMLAFPTFRVRILFNNFRYEYFSTTQFICISMKMKHFILVIWNILITRESFCVFCISVSFCIFLYLCKDKIALKNKFLMVFILGSQTENQSGFLGEPPSSDTFNVVT